jgi:hypothetical protein
MELALATLALVFAAIPAALFLRNLRAFKPPPVSGAGTAAVSVLIPARNEEETIGAAIASVLGSQGVTLEVIVLDDGSTDATEAVVRAIASVDSRVALASGEPLPDGWCGKQHACATLAEMAKYPVLCFMDADVRLTHDALARMAAFVDTTGADLASGVPRQETRTFLEKLVIPLIHFVLLGFLPLDRMRRSTHPAYAAGCGQLFIAGAGAYNLAGGHAAIRSSLHDGLTLPRAFRRASLITDLFDATGVSVCRMYRSGADVWRGLAKNAVEGLGAPRRIVPITLLLGIGQIAPLPLVFAADGLSRIIACAALVCSYLPRLVAVSRFDQPLVGAMLHPVGVSVLLAIQWHALIRRLSGRRAQWKGRSYNPGAYAGPG